MADRHIPDDEYIDDKDCGNKLPHTDHYWILVNGWVKTTDIIDDKVETWYCYGR